MQKVCENLFFEPTSHRKNQINGECDAFPGKNKKMRRSVMLTDLPTRPDPQHRYIFSIKSHHTLLEICGRIPNPSAEPVLAYGLWWRCVHTSTALPHTVVPKPDLPHRSGCFAHFLKKIRTVKRKTHENDTPKKKQARLEYWHRLEDWWTVFQLHTQFHCTTTEKSRLSSKKSGVCNFRMPVVYGRRAIFVFSHP